MKCRYKRSSGRIPISKHRPDPLAHLASRLIGKGDRQNLVRRHSLSDKMIDTRREDARFTAPRARENRDRAVDSEYRPPLGIIQSFEVFHLPNIP